MKYRFRPSDLNTPSRIKNIKVKHLRLMGKNTLRKLRPLPTPIEQVRLDDDFEKAQRRKRYDFKPIKKRIKCIYSALYKLICKISKELLAFFKLLFAGLCSLISLIGAKILKLFKSFNPSYFSLPMLTGALCSALLVCTISASYILFGLFLPYTRRYETVTIPRLEGESELEAKNIGDKFNVIVKYENNPEVSDGTVIFQSPSPGVTRRIYEKDGCCDISITVSRHKELTVPKGLVGASLRDASLSLLNSQISFEIIEEYSSVLSSGQVISVYPKCGSKINAADKVTLTVAKKQLYNE